MIVISITRACGAAPYLDARIRGFGKGRVFQLLRANRFTG